MDVVHKSVLLQECLSLLKPASEDTLFVDGTLGEGGHTEAFLKTYPQLSAIGIDADPTIQAKAKLRLQPFASRVQYFSGWSDDFFKNYSTEYPKPNIILFDLGISMFHYIESGRGFSFQAEEPLDMRINPATSLSAAEIINTYKEEELASIFYTYGEERFSRKIAGAICLRRKEQEFKTAGDLAEVIFKAVPPAYRHGRIHPATRSFQALRIKVNGELDRLPDLLKLAFQRLALNGKLGVISFHSLEDRIVKRYFRDLAKNCRCPPEMPICKCGGRPLAQLLTGKPVIPTDEEIRVNPASRSAKLRAVKKILTEEGAA
ncbi:16S rRNA (cytosine(1402)-N(4))-methyltransferase [Treponema phagedenis]|uniref:Ribosomal RNA small subunit methyltransferase H n=1 Tax=Treponema phagedenis TaxID=162 RepID=A0A0B7GTE9_TREPH|nr:16S rRNA (cytosine(1402)-N(4))-methyltransferase RsmH [Treponema phagedenis]NVP24564.1 16S rRNA (cytosine(1402)-N(4))-methyltransferase RsmH [Treponema phagedenis]QEJ94739.1 16S rRNA (cytosine(1402)-N(4))-methyltransferase RsmH [Treponema phagedenis]QEJ97675.1 16S rRNA (cytosine(1402)-N(4))-methyltransferase RsmH [Treponema phagedenis]QEK00644.1 16S rRNA (cytosine(1402)-N(4))-methyltransferase RsmH [Treponema phagedenis]QEK03244.1 16S rRNA (cytosine(1402)-N(4))-methyltransferase RsmH [Trepo